MPETARRPWVDCQGFLKARCSENEYPAANNIPLPGEGGTLGWPRSKMTSTTSAATEPSYSHHPGCRNAA